MTLSITRDTWIQGRLLNLKNPSQRCLIGHMVQHGGLDDYSLALMSSVIRDKFPTRITNTDISRFNDHPDTAFEDIRLVVNEFNRRMDLRDAQ